MTLPDDVSRCIGQVVNGTYQLRLACINCQRRTAPRAEVYVMHEPPTEHPCPMRIAPEEQA